MALVKPRPAGPCCGGVVKDMGDGFLGQEVGMPVSIPDCAKYYSAKSSGLRGDRDSNVMVGDRRENLVCRE